MSSVSFFEAVVVAELAALSAEFDPPGVAGVAEVAFSWLPLAGAPFALVPFGPVPVPPPVVCGEVVVGLVTEVLDCAFVFIVNIDNDRVAKM